MSDPIEFVNTLLQPTHLILVHDAYCKTAIFIPDTLLELKAGHQIELSRLRIQPEGKKNRFGLSFQQTNFLVGSKKIAISVLDADDVMESEAEPLDIDPNLLPELKRWPLEFDLSDFPELDASSQGLETQKTDNSQDDQDDEMNGSG